MYEDQEQIEIARGEGDGEQKSMANFDGIDQSIVAETSDKMKERKREREGVCIFLRKENFCIFGLLKNVVGNVLVRSSRTIDSTVTFVGADK